MTPDCVFCKIVAGSIPSTKILETDTVYSFLDIGPVSQGHCLIIPKQHYETVDQCPPETLADLAQHLGKLASAVKAVTQAQGYNILCNNGRSAGQLVDHVHFHIIPRFEGDNLFNHWPAGEYPSGAMGQLADRIIAQLA